MKNSLIILLATVALLQSCTSEGNETAAGSTSTPYALVIHGGAGAITRAAMTPEMEQEYLKVLNEALDIGETILKEGGASLDAVEKTIMYLEDSPLFNAGKGAVFTHEGKNELDASVMDGASLKAGAAGGLTIVRNPIRAARAVMEKSPHVLLVGKGAEQFAIEQKIDTVSPEYFFTQERWDALERAKAAENAQEGALPTNPDYKFGTVGCVALDQKGNIAAGTSTGGMTNKRWNRLGDAPIIGAGTYANNATCGVSCTGHGEFFIRYAVAHDVSAMMEYKGSSVQEAGEFIVNQKLKNAGGEGGLIALDKKGNIAMPFNSEGMYRGYAKAGERVVKIYKE